MVLFKTLVFTILVPGTVAGGIPWLLVQGSSTSLMLMPSISLIGFLPLLLGVGLNLWAAGAFTFLGKGTPAPIDPPKILVIQGCYQWVRSYRPQFGFAKLFLSGRGSTPCRK
jgi:protein-S-isoprenylcysteine O-methyltransferase Ste14